MFSKERLIRPTRMPGKMILFHILCFVLLLLDDLEAFIWNYYLEQPWFCNYSIFSVQLLAIPNQNGIWLSYPTLPILYRSTEDSNIEACGFEGIVQSRNNSGRSNDGQRCCKPLYAYFFILETEFEDCLKSSGKLQFLIAGVTLRNTVKTDTHPVVWFSKVFTCKNGIEADETITVFNRRLLPRGLSLQDP